MPTAYQIVPFARDGGIRILVARTRLIQRWRGRGKIPGRIPHHAGQWILDGGTIAGDTPIEIGAVQGFRARTGIDLANPSEAARYGLATIASVAFQDSTDRPVSALFLPVSPTGLDRLADDVNRNIDNLDLEDGVFSEVVATSVADALSRFGPIPPPSRGWAAFIITNYYDGPTPGALDTDLVALTNQIAIRSKEPADRFELALAGLH